MKTYALCLLMMIVGACGFGYIVGYHFGYEQGTKDANRDQDEYIRGLLKAFGHKDVKVERP